MRSLLEDTIEETLKFHRYEYYKRQIQQSPCPVLDGPGIVQYCLDSTECISISPIPDSEDSSGGMTASPGVGFNNVGCFFLSKPMENIRNDLPHFLGWYWVERFNLEKVWNLPDPRDWQDYQKEMIARCIGTMTDRYDGLECSFYVDNDCPCAMVNDALD